MNLWSAIYSAPEGYSRPPKVNSCDGSDRTVATVQPHGRFPTAVGERFGSVRADTRWRAGADWVVERICSAPTLRPDSKRTRPGSEPRPRPRPEPGPAPAPARARMRACAGIVPSQSRAKTPSTQKARPLFSIFSIYTPRTSIPWPMWD